MIANEFIPRLKKRWKAILFPIIGLSSLIWFLIRVIPKPSRATYPCMKVAAPLASTFVIYLIGLVTSVVAYTKGKSTRLIKYKPRVESAAAFYNTITEWNNANGVDGNVIAGNIDADPLLEDPENGNFRFRSNSSYKALGIGIADDIVVGIDPRFALPAEVPHAGLPAPSGLRIDYQ